jgi:hypothetical protein
MNLDVQPTTYPIAGFFVPGIFCLTMLALPFLLSLPDASAFFRKILSDRYLSGTSKVRQAILIGSLSLILSAIAFVVGTFFSEAYIYLYRVGFEKIWTGGDPQVSAEQILKDGPSLESLLARTDISGSGEHTGSYIREAFVMSHTGGLNLYWWMSRERMLGACGLCLILVACLFAISPDWRARRLLAGLRPGPSPPADGSKPVPSKGSGMALRGGGRRSRGIWAALACLAFGFSFLWVASYRYRVFYQFMAAESAVLLREKQFDAARPPPP